MIIKELGKYRLTQDIKTGTSTSIATLPKGLILNITQIDSEYHKVIGPELWDWKYWDLPVETLTHTGRE